MPAISVIVPVYNTEQYLYRCIDSILTQTFTDFELILVDDGSPDNCGMICEEYAEKDERIIVIHQSNKGQAAARNAAIHVACGKYVAFVDSDDVVHEQYLEVLMRPISDSMKTIVICSALESEKCPPSFFELKGDEIAFRCLNIDEETLLKLYCISYCCGTIWGKLIPISIVRKHLFTVNRTYEDNAVVVKWLCEIQKVYISDAPLYFYQINKNGTTKSRIDRKKTFDSFWAIGEQIDFFKRKNYQRLMSRTMGEMLIVCAYRYNITSEVNPQLSIEIRKFGEKKWREYKHHITLEVNEKNYILEMLYPRIMKVYIFLHNWFHRNHQDN